MDFFRGRTSLDIIGPTSRLSIQFQISRGKYSDNIFQWRSCLLFCQYDNYYICQTCVKPLRGWQTFLCICWVAIHILCECCCCDNNVLKVLMPLCWHLSLNSKRLFSKITDMIAIIKSKSQNQQPWLYDLFEGTRADPNEMLLDTLVANQKGF